MAVLGGGSSGIGSPLVGGMFYFEAAGDGGGRGVEVPVVPRRWRRLAVAVAASAAMCSSGERGGAGDLCLGEAGSARLLNSGMTRTRSS